MTTPPLADVPIRSAEELTAHWTAAARPADLRLPQPLADVAARTTACRCRRCSRSRTYPGCPTTACCSGCSRCTRPSPTSTWTAAVTWRWLCAGRAVRRSPRTTTRGSALLSEVLDDRIDGSLEPAPGRRRPCRAPDRPAGMTGRTARSLTCERRDSGVPCGRARCDVRVRRRGRLRGLGGLPPAPTPANVARSYIEARFDRRLGTAWSLTCRQGRSPYPDFDAYAAQSDDAFRGYVMPKAVDIDATRSRRAAMRTHRSCGSRSRSGEGDPWHRMPEVSVVERGRPVPGVRRPGPGKAGGRPPTAARVGHPIRRPWPSCPQFRDGRASDFRTLPLCVIFGGSSWVWSSGRRCSPAARRRSRPTTPCRRRAPRRRPRRCRPWARPTSRCPSEARQQTAAGARHS